MTMPSLNAKTLIIEDFEGMRSVLKGICKTIGITDVDFASNGAGAISMLSKSRYDIVICDYDLGPGPDGQQVLEEAKARNYVGYGCVWIIVTAEKTIAMVASAVETKADDYLIKPVSAATLENRLLKLISKKRSFGEIETAVNEHDYRKAIELCDRLMQSKSAAAGDLLRIKADLLMATNDLEGAQALFQSVLAKRSVPWAKTGLGKVYYLREDYERAKHLLGEALDESPVYLDAADWLAKAHEALEEANQAQAVLQRATAVYPKSPVRQKALADTAYRNGDLDVAQSAYETAIKSGEHSIHKSVEHYAGLAKVLAEKDDPREALAVLEKGLQEFPDNAEAAVQTAVVKAMACRKMGDRYGAEAAMQEAGELIDGMSGVVSPGITIDMAKTLFTLGKGDEACSLLKTLVMENHENTAIIDQVNRLLDSQHMRDAGKQMVEKSRQEVVEINNKGVLLARSGKFAEAIALLRKAVQQLPNNAVMVGNLCGVLIGSMKQGGKDEELVMEAKMLLDRVSELNPMHPKYHEYMNALVQLG